MRTSSILLCGPVAACMALVVPALVAQNSILLFSPVDVRSSVTGTTYDAPNTFNSTTLNLTCPASPTATLSSANGGNILVDNNIQVSTSSPSITGPTNACTGGTSDYPNGVQSPNCFTSAYQLPAGDGNLVAQNPDNLVAAGGVAPLDIHESLVPGANQITISLVDGGGYLASSSVYLNTNCTQTGVTGPANITGNPISQSNPTPPQLTQNFNFNTNTNQQVQFTYDLAKAQAAGTLSITDGTIPGTEDLPVDPATFQSVYVPQTSFSTSNCLVHTGEALPTSGLAACKLFTLECTVGAGSSESGALCPVSSMPNELFQDVFDGPAFTLPDIQTPNNGPTFHEGVGFLMASEDWNGGPCSFDPASGLESLPCPQNLLTSFSGPGLYIASGYTSHPNSTFIPVTGVPEDLTTVTVAGEQNGGWVNKSTANVTFSSQPPNLAGVTESQLPGVSEICRCTDFEHHPYGISPASNVPVPGAPVSTDTTVNSNVVCPTATSSGSPATVFTPPVQSLTGLADGSYLIHYFAQDCAGTEELSFQQDGTGSWSTSYYTVPLNVDTIAPSRRFRADAFPIDRQLYARPGRDSHLQLHG